MSRNIVKTGGNGKLVAGFIDPTNLSLISASCTYQSVSPLTKKEVIQLSQNYIVPSIAGSPVLCDNNSFENFCASRNITTTEISNNLEGINFTNHFLIIMIGARGASSPKFDLFTNQGDGILEVSYYRRTRTMCVWSLPPPNLCPAYYSAYKMCKNGWNTLKIRNRLGFSTGSLSTSDVITVHPIT